MFTDAFTLVTAASGPAIPEVQAAGVHAGVYDDGLITILDRDLSMELARPWQWLLGTDVLPFAITGFGDLFLYSPSRRSCHFLEVQRASSAGLEPDVGATLNAFLAQPGAKEAVLQSSFVTPLVSRLGPLRYGKCFIAEPWQLLGGSGAPDTYAVGDAAVYFSLLAPVVKDALDERRRTAPPR